MIRIGAQMRWRGVGGRVESVLPGEPCLVRCLLLNGSRIVCRSSEALMNSDVQEDYEETVKLDPTLPPGMHVMLHP